MKIRKIRLQNIKSYVDQEVSFHEGVNFISGINGAGKSTLIEAIGCALFDYNPGTISEFVRYGARYGTITIEFCANDDREYRIVRKVGTNSSWTVYDLESEGEIDLHGNRDVKEWLKGALGIDRDIELEQLFQDIIGVPQGTFVGPFLETPAIRKKKFDSILKVEQYREAFSNTGKALSMLKERINTVNNNLNVMAEGVKDYDHVKNEITELEGKMKVLVIKLKEYEELIRKKENDVRLLEGIKNEIDRNESNLKILEANKTSLIQRQKDLNADLTKAKNARKSVQSSEKGYNSYLRVEEELKAFEAKRNEKETIEKEYNRVKQEIARIEAMLREKDESLKKQQEEILNNKNKITVQMRELTGLINKAREELEETKSRQDKSTTWKDAEESLVDLNKQLQQIMWDIESKEEQVNNLSIEEKELGKKLQELPEIEKIAGAYEVRENAYQNTRKEYAVLDHRLKTLKKNLEQSKGGLCPFLESPCQNVQGNLEEHFTGQIKETSREMEILKEKGLDLKKERDKSETAQREMIKLQADKERLDYVIAQKKKFTDEITRLFAKGSDLPLVSYLDKLQQSAGHKFAGSIEVSPRLPDTLASLEDILGESKNKRETIEKSLGDELTISSNRLAKLEADNKNAQQNLEQLLSKEKQAVMEIEALEKKREEAGRLKTKAEQIEGSLSEYKDLPEQIQNVKNQQVLYRKDFETYIQNKSEAGKAEALETELNKLSAEIEDNKNKIIASQKLKEDLQIKFNHEEYQTKKTELIQLKQDEAKEKQIMVERRDDLQESRRKMEQMEKVIKKIESSKQELAADQKSMALLDLVRSILNNAGPPIARVYLENLSREANELYRRVSRENVMLEWREGYEIVLIDNFNGRSRERTFKQLSGGEQMTAALAVRLALLKQQSRVKVGFFDEPTANLDSERRSSLAETIPHVTGGFNQIFIISHDDTFDSMTDNIIQLKKNEDTGSLFNE